MRIFVFFLFLISALGWGGQVSAGPQTQLPENIPETCDAEFYKIMSNRAWMEGKREMEAAQTFILKPDSVLEYSCFRNRGLDMAGQLTFSDGGNMTAVAIDGGNASYLEQNFDHIYGGGLGPAAGEVCDAMYQVWDFLKCQAFDIDNFTLLSAMAGNDLRALPLACTNANQRAADWSYAIETVNPPPASPAALGGMDAVEVYLSRLNPALCSNHTPIPTGLMIRRRTADSATALHAEKICSMPGCNYNLYQDRCEESF